jgi:hypothetical protein
MPRSSSALPGGRIDQVLQGNKIDPDSGIPRAGPERLGCFWVEPKPHGFRQFAAGFRPAENAICDYGGVLA